jgi:hypothetical protein
MLFIEFAVTAGESIGRSYTLLESVTLETVQALKIASACDIPFQRYGLHKTSILDDKKLSQLFGQILLKPFGRTRESRYRTDSRRFKAT